MKYRVLAIAGLLSLFGFLMVPVATHAASNMRSGDTPTIAKGETIDASAYLAGTNVTVAGEVRGDLYCAGQNITITGTVEGDVICAGQSVTISGRVLGNVRVAGQTVNIASSVGRSVSGFGQNLALTGNAVVNNDATLFGSNTQIDGKVNRDLVGGGQMITIGGSVGRNVNIQSERPSLMSGARVGGSFDYTSRNQLQVSSDANIAGKTERHEPQHGDEGAQQDAWMTRFWGIAYWFGALLVFGLVVLGVAPRTYKTAHRLMIQQGGWALLAGLTALVVTPVLAIALAITIIGIPLGITLGLLWMIALVMSFLYSGYSFGAWVAEQASWKLKWPMLSSFVIGLTLLALVMMVPIVGGLFTFLALVWGLGGLVLAAGSYIKHRNEPFPAEKAKPAKKAKA